MVNNLIIQTALKSKDLIKTLLKHARLKADDKGYKIVIGVVLYDAYRQESGDDILTALSEFGANLNTLIPQDNPESVFNQLLESREIPVSVIQRAIKNGADVNHTNHYGYPVLFDASADLAKLNLLISSGANPLSINKLTGQNLLHSALSTFNRENQVAVVRRIIDLGVDVNAKDKVGNTPLHDAAFWAENVAVLRDLLQAGANPLARNNKGETALDLANRKSNQELREAFVRFLRKAHE